MAEKQEEHKKAGAEEEEEEDSEEEEETPMQFVAGLDNGVRQNVLAMQALQKEYQDAFVEYMGQVHEVEAVFRKKCDPLYSRRAALVKGDAEPTEEELQQGEEAAPSRVEGIEEAAAGDAVTGIPDFWLTAMMNCDVMQGAIQEHDRDALKHLRNITVEHGENKFKMSFEFAENPYFSNTVLTKEVGTKMDPVDGEDMLKSLEGCKIDWKEGQNLTVEIKKKKQRSKQTKQTRVVTREEPRESFFNFFSPTKVPEATEDFDDEAAEKVEEDFQHCQHIARVILPRAVAYYTGEAIPVLDIPDGLLDGADEEGGEEGGKPAQNPECKQQ